jgi:hypothetical protein
MTTYSLEDLIAIQRCNATLILCNALRATAKHAHPQDRARAMLSEFERLSRADQQDLIALLTLPKLPPSGRSAPSLSHHAPGTERPTARGI